MSSLLKFHRLYSSRILTLSFKIEQPMRTMRKAQLSNSTNVCEQADNTRSYAHIHGYTCQLFCFFTYCFQEFNEIHLEIIHEAKKIFYFRFSRPPPASYWNVNKGIRRVGRGREMTGKKRKKLEDLLTEWASFLFLFSILALSSSHGGTLGRCFWVEGSQQRRFERGWSCAAHLLVAGLEFY